MDLALTDRQQRILAIVKTHGNSSISQIEELLTESISRPTLNRDLAALVSEGVIAPSGSARARTYSVTDRYLLFAPLPPNAYFDQEPDKRGAHTQFNFKVFDLLRNMELFSSKEQGRLAELQEQYRQNISAISDAIYKKELERLTIELSWKSSQIEGNTYSLLE